MPSLAQLDEAVRAFMAEFPDMHVTVVVDATFGHRIDSSEVPAFDEAVANAEIVSPPAGAFGRGDAFLLRIAEKVDADVLSNDSFQEFHGEHEWLFDRGRLIGGKPVPGIGWIFTARSPVRGPKSREAMRKAGQSGRSPAVSAAIKTATDEATSVGRSRRGGRGRGGSRRVEPTERGPEEPKIGDVRTAPLSNDEINSDAARRRQRGAVPSDPVNEPMVFLGFVASHRPGAVVEGTVEEFTSHGAFVRVGEARCYMPLSAMGDPPPRAARDVVIKGETRQFVVQALDPPRRGIEIAIPEFANISGSPSPETVEQEINATKPSRAKKAAAKKVVPAKKAAVAKENAAATEAPVKKTSRRSAKSAPVLPALDPVVPDMIDVVAPPADIAAVVEKKRRAPRKAAVKRQAASARPAPLAKAAAAKQAAPKQAAPKKAAAKKVAAPKKAAAEKIAPDRATAKKAPAKKTAKKATKAAPPAAE